jgi:N-acetylmuramic acid 6-phosphate etherase
VKENLAVLLTEQNNPDTYNIDRSTAREISDMLCRENMKATLAVERASAEIADAIELIAGRLARGGRMVYVGAGTSGHLGVVDASECPATFGVPPTTVQAVIPGGTEAIWDASIGDEDDGEAAAAEMKRLAIGEDDVVVGIAASGRTPYVLGALKAAKELNAAVISITNNPKTQLEALADIAIVAAAGPEPIQGSTRMKSGTAQKMILNMLSTGAMVVLGKVYHNLMVDVMPVNEKLKDRAARIVAQAAGADEALARKALENCGGNAKRAIVTILKSCGPEEAERLLKENGGSIARVVG